MSIKKMKIPALFAMFLGLVLCTPNAFADSNYGIVYEGGTKLGADNVSTLNKELTELMPTITSVDYTGSGWETEDSYVKYGSNCFKVGWAKFPNNSSSNDITYGYTVHGKDASGHEYVAEVDIRDVSFIPSNANDANKVTVAIDGNGNINGGRIIYSNSECTTVKDDTVKALTLSGDAMFVKTNIKLYSVYNNKEKKTFKSNELYFEITDIDGAQAYKILNSGNELSKSTMFAKDVSKLQPLSPTSTMKNMYVSDTTNGNYIYSYCTSSTDCDITSGGNDMYVKIGSEVQKETVGLDMVFGYKLGAASNIKYFAEKLKVTYISDEHGEISNDCITSEEVFSGNNPFGSCSVPDENYQFTHWVADKDVTLDSGEKISKGKPLTPEQVKQVVVTEDIEFEAIHESAEVPAKAPDTGASTSEMSAVQIATISVMGVLMVGLAIRLLPRLFHNKVKFD